MRVQDLFFKVFFTQIQNKLERGIKAYINTLTQIPNNLLFEGRLTHEHLNGKSVQKHESMLQQFFL